MLRAGPWSVGELAAAAGTSRRTAYRVVGVLRELGYQFAPGPGLMVVGEPAACAVLACPNPPEARGLCYSHYAKAKRAGESLPPVQERSRKVCACGKVALARGLCRKCYDRERHEKAPGPKTEG